MNCATVKKKRSVSATRVRKQTTQLCFDCLSISSYSLIVSTLASLSLSLSLQTNFEAHTETIFENNTMLATLSLMLIGAALSAPTQGSVTQVASFKIDKSPSGLFYSADHDLLVWNSQKKTNTCAPPLTLLLCSTSCVAHKPMATTTCTRTAPTAQKNV